MELGRPRCDDAKLGFEERKKNGESDRDRLRDGEGEKEKIGAFNM